VRIIGYGNWERGDDGVGLFIADRLRKRHMNAQAYSGDPIGLLELWGDSGDVLLVDAVVTGAPAGTVYLFNARQPWPIEKSPASGHGIDLAQALELARTLNCLPDQLRICGIEGRDFGIGERLSRPVLRTARAVVKWLVSRDPHNLKIHLPRVHGSDLSRDEEDLQPNSVVQD
jgi:hydrogenase maturation protease